jgi:hypothetical protein
MTPAPYTRTFTDDLAQKDSEADRGQLPAADQGSNYHTLNSTTRLPAAHWRKLNYNAKASAALRQIKNAGGKTRQRQGGSSCIYRSSGSRGAKGPTPDLT